MSASQKPGKQFYLCSDHKSILFQAVWKASIDAESVSYTGACSITDTKGVISNVNIFVFVSDCYLLQVFMYNKLLMAAARVSSIC